jgi:hypothetical protein
MHKKLLLIRKKFLKKKFEKKSLKKKVFFCQTISYIEV